MTRLFFTFGAYPEHPFGNDEFIEVDGDTQEQCIELFKAAHPNPEGLVNCKQYYNEKDFLPVYKEYYAPRKPSELISLRKNAYPAPPKSLRINDIYVGDLVWIEDRKDDVWARQTGYAECTDDGSIKRSNKGGIEFYGCGTFKTFPIKQYGITWRCWNERPGIFIRESEAWKEESSQE